MKKWLFNPFEFIAGFRSLILGWIFMLATAFLGQFHGVHFDGVLDMHSGRQTVAWFYYAEQLTDWATATLLFYIAGRIGSRSAIRFVDVAGTMALSRWVMIFAAIVDLGILEPVLPKGHSIQDLVNSIGIVFIVGAFLELIIMVWFVTLLYNAFSVSCNLKGGKAAGIFTVTLIAAEFLSKSFIFLMYKTLH